MYFIISNWKVKMGYPSFQLWIYRRKDETSYAEVQIVISAWFASSKTWQILISAYFSHVATIEKQLSKINSTCDIIIGRDYVRWHVNVESYNVFILPFPNVSISQFLRIK